MKPSLFSSRLRSALALGLALASGLAAARAGETPFIETPRLRFTLQPDTGRYELLDRAAGVAWQSNPFQPRFGEVALKVGGPSRRLSLARCQVEKAEAGLIATFTPLAEQPEAHLRVRVRPRTDERVLEFSWEADPALAVESVRLLDQALWTTDADRGYVLVPVREGLLIPADSGLSFTQRFDTYAYEGCHLTMLGAVKGGAAALLTWTDPYVTAEVRSALTNLPGLQARQTLALSLSLRRSARAFQVHLLGRGDYVDIARAYRAVARQTGWWVPWSEKLKDHPERAKYFGASNYKLWSLLSRRMNEDSSKELSVRVNWTFEEAAQIAEHLKHDLQLDRVIFILGGWIHRGYDNQHPDILPTAPECGGDAAFSNACRRIRALGFLLSLHDNYQDIYRDSPSWNEDYIMKTADGKLHAGGSWAGGRAYLTCSKKALELAQRPQNLPAVKRLSDADSYFIDTTYAAGLQECFDPGHPLSRADDMKWKQALSDYARGLFGSFGSECGREWAIPHADFFEGLTGVGGKYYHSLDPAKLGATVVPLFELVYRDCIQLYGKYGYDPARAADYVLHHLSLGRPLHYHNVPPGLYWQKEWRASAPLALRPAVAEVRQTGPRQFAITYRWQVDKTPAEDWRVFVHFCDATGAIRFQNDYQPPEPTSKWAPGEVRHGPFTVSVPEGLSGTFHVRLGLFQDPNGPRALLAARQDKDRAVLAGQLTVHEGRITFAPATPAPAAAPAGDPGVFTRADGGWAEGLHPYDRFVKNTHEILSPLNELTARVPMTQHEFLTADRRVRRSVFGEGATAVEVVVNHGPAEYRHRTRSFGEVLLPPIGFVVEAPTFAAFHARSWNGLRYDDPPLFTLRSLDGRPLNRSKQVRVFHGFGDPRLRLGGAVRTVAREAVL